ncbi:MULTISPECIES: hypothetical protein [unclassified Hyphomicrobium]|uniref:hypothetical protein n=1 Tax=unclassified Hyphomicrobium TaxID=2619925 RepID=UPI000213DFB4|nr:MULTISPECIES: hypothetical protein [unclassified Hyphomicrobium]CCB66408.1 conserved exported protein of unknown function [Hyphomicrobium sp. MC1]
MLFHRSIAAAVFATALLVTSGANAFETTSIGGAPGSGTANYKDPDELGAALSPSTSSSSSPFSNFNFSVGQAPDNADGARTNWLNGPGSPNFGFTGSQSTSVEPASPFNTPILRDRN